MKKIIYVLACFCWSLAGVQAQETFPRNGVYDERPGVVALTNATIFTDPQTRIDNATLIIRKGKVEAVGKNVSIPQGASIVNLNGRYIYPGFVDIYTSYGLPEVQKPKRNGRGTPQIDATRQGAYTWNDAIKSETNAADLFAPEKKQAEELRKLGFGSVLTINKDGIARGTAALVTLGSKRANEEMLNSRAAAAYSFDKGTSTQDYPSSLMGSIALLRQTYLDAQWHSRSGDGSTNLSLKAFNDNQTLPQIFEATDMLSILRADKIAKEFKSQYIIKGNGDEYRRIDEIKATRSPLLISLNFPDAYDVEDPHDAVMVSLEDMKHWEMAPANAAMLSKAGVVFAFTASDLKDKNAFLPNLRKAVKHGLPENEALRALTTTPAQLVKAENVLGSLRNGTLANFIITTGNLFEDETLILENWVQGEKLNVNDAPIDIRGNYTLNIEKLPAMRMEIGGKPGKSEVKVFVKDTTNVKASMNARNGMITVSFVPDAQAKGAVRLSGWFTGEGKMRGDAQLADGSWAKWTAAFSAPFKEQPAPATAKKDSISLGSLTYPFLAFGYTLQEAPKQETVLIRNATVWTNERDGKLERADVLIQNGKIAHVGKNISAGNARVIDGTGKHLTPGIIDEHSHIAITKGVNEGTQSVTSEVRVGDALNSEDINIYRQLAGGVTAAQLLHGSANAIGGQSALVKLRWGLAPEKMKVEGADGFIKFALGENVKQSNWGEAQKVRFPQSRMGVEQVFVDAFTRAKEYEKAMKGYNSLSSRAKAKTAAPRRDLELDALVEILNKQRFITCHSYVQSEINMLLHVADTMGFKVNTFTHILEGYKVADKMKRHGVGGSTFADWWAYKMEVKDAIPYNAAIMHRVGLVTSINSDDAEMGRRLNQEAAKTVKYGGVSEEEALKMVTLNPAIMLHLDDRMGSIRAGKDADLVLWNEHPLSIYAKPEKTFVDGIAYYDLEKDIQMRNNVRTERNRLIQKMLQAKQGGQKTQAPSPKKDRLYHCEDVFDVFAEEHAE
jgi:imidazolonepropionase-like amidohydrolase